MCAAARSFAAALILIPTCSNVRAAHPLITEDTGTQGTGRFQLELSLERAIEDEHDLHEKAWHAAATLSHGLRDNLDLILGGTWLHFHTLTAGEDVQNLGFGDVTFDLKWRFYAIGDFSIAFKPGVVVPTGDEDEGLGEGETRYNMSLVFSYEPEPWGFHLHLASFLNPGIFDWSDGISHLSGAVTHVPRENLKLVADLGHYELAAADRAPGMENPMFLTLGVIWSLREKADLDFGLRFGLNDSEVDRTLLLGTAFRW